MLQTKHQDGRRINLQSLLEEAVLDLTKVKEQDQAVADFAAMLKNTAESWLKMPESQKDGLFKRASQNPDLQHLAKEFSKFPVATQAHITDALFTSDAVQAVFEAMPDAHRIGLVQEVAAVGEVDSAVSGKPQTTTEQTAEGKVTTTRDGQYFHQYKKTKHGTDTTTRSKNGHEHRHSHEFKDGKTSTVSVSKARDWELAHGHTHSFKDGKTETNTVSVSKSNLGDSTWTHSHEHDDKTGKEKTETHVITNGESTLHHLFHDENGDGVAEENVAHLDVFAGWARDD